MTTLVLGRVVAATGAIAMVSALVWGSTRGELSAEFATLLAMPWGLGTLVEVYVGLLLFGAWVWTREQRSFVALAWLVAIGVLGNIVSCLYVLTALHDAKGDLARFWLGARR